MEVLEGLAGTDACGPVDRIHFASYLKGRGEAS